MGNQQPSTLENRIKFLAVETVFGDGYLWRHPECKNYKIRLSSTTEELLKVKEHLVPEIFSSGVKALNTSGHAGRFANAKPLYRLDSTVHPIITEIAQMSKTELVKELTLKHLGLWYLDDGCAVVRKDAKNSYRISIAIGDTCNTPEKEAIFKARLEALFGKDYGRIAKNNSKATDSNKSWIIPKPVATLIMNEARKYKVLEHKLPLW